MIDRPSPNPLYARRLPDKILVAFNHACDLGDLETARLLLACCETAMRNTPLPLRERRRAAETLCGAYERLWLLRHAHRAVMRAMAEAE